MDSKLINPANKRKFKIIVVGSGLAGGSAAATLSELGYKVDCFCYQDSPRRAHSIAAQGGINAAKNYQVSLVLTIQGVLLENLQSITNLLLTYKIILIVQKILMVIRLVIHLGLMMTNILHKVLQETLHMSLVLAWH